MYQVLIRSLLLQLQSLVLSFCVLAHECAMCDVYLRVPGLLQAGSPLHLEESTSAVLTASWRSGAATCAMSGCMCYCCVTNPSADLLGWDGSTGG